MGHTTIIFVIVLCALASCTSPESGRPRGGGPGADVGNRRKFALMHEGSDPFYKTPKLIAGQSAPLASARQADKLSR